MRIAFKCAVCHKYTERNSQEVVLIAALMSHELLWLAVLVLLKASLDLADTAQWIQLSTPPLTRTAVIPDSKEKSYPRPCPATAFSWPPSQEPHASSLPRNGRGRGWLDPARLSQSSVSFTTVSCSNMLFLISGDW